MTREEFDKILSGENYRPRRSREEFNELIGIPAPQRKSTVTQPQNQQTAPPTSAGLPVKQSLPYDRYGYRKPSFGESAPRGSYMDYWEYQKKSNPLIDPPRAMTENDPSIGDMAKAALDTVVYGTASKAAQLVTYGLNQQAKMGQETEAARQELFSRMREGPPLDYNDKDIQQLMSQSTGMGLLPFSLKDRDPTTKDWITQHFEDKYRTGKELLLRGKSGPEQFFTDALLSSGQMLGDAAISSVTGIPVPVYAGLTGGAEAGQKALDEGYSADQAAMMALGSGAISAGVESIGGFGGDLGEAVGKKLLSSGKVPQKIVDYVSKLSGNKLVELLGDAASEGGEEFLEYDLQRLYENLILDKDTPRDIKEQLHNTAIGAFAGGLYGTARQATDFLSSKLNKESGLTSGEVQANSDPSEEKTLISLEEFKDTQADVWRNVDYSDQQTKAQITSEVSDEMLSAGEYVELQDADLEKFASYFPDLRSQKKADRIPVIRQKTAEVKLLLRNFLEQNFKGKPIELNLNGRILEAKLHDVGIKEVLEKITQTKAATIDKTGEIFSKAKYLYSTQDKAGNPNIYRWNYFYVPLKIGDDTFGVRIAVRDIISSNESQIYNYGIKKEATLPGGPGGRNPSGTNGTSVASFNPTLPQPRNNVNATAGLPEAPKPHLPTATEAQANQAEPRGQLGAGLPYAPGYETQLSGERLGISRDKIDRINDLSKRTGVTVEFTDQLEPGRDGLYLNGKIYISKDAKSPAMEIFKHELTHYVESSGAYNDLQNFIMDSNIFRASLGGKDVAQYRAEVIEDYALRGVTLDEDGANREIVARFVSENLFTSDAEIGRLTAQKPNLAKRIYQWIQDTIRKLTGTPEEKFLIEARRKYEKALQTVQDGAGQAEYSIQTLPDGKQYVQADRLVVQGDNPYKWGEQVKNFINEYLREGKDVTLYTQDGYSVVLGEDTAGKAAFWNERTDPATGKKVRVKEDTYLTKLNAEAHIDELMETATLHNTDLDIEDHSHGKKAEYGWRYFTAYFEDFDGQYYETPISVRMGEDGNVVYNVGDVKRRNHPALTGSSSKGGAQKGYRMASDTRVPQGQPGVNPYSMQNGEKNAQYSINPDFGRQVDEWFRKGRPNGGYFYIGNTSEPLKSVGITDGAIYFDRSKINKNIKDHNLTQDIIKQLPGMLEDPIVILESKTQANSVVVFGEVYDTAGNPVMASVQMGLNPVNKQIQGVVTKITSAYGKEGDLSKFINEDDLLYINPDMERTRQWFRLRRLQLPVEGTLSGSIRSISYVPRDSNGNFSFGPKNTQSKTPMQAAMEKAGLQLEDGGQYAIAPPETRPESAATVPEAPRPGEKESAFSDTLQNKQSIFDERFKKLAWDDRTIRSYEGITNRATLEEANAELNDGGESYVVKWMGKDPSEATAKDVAAGFLMMDRYQQVGDYDSMVEVAEHLRKMGTSGGQTIQMFSIFSRMTPEGMIAYAQKSLSNAFDAMSEGKTQKWIDQNRAKFRLTGEDVDFIRRRMLQAEKLPAGRDKNILLGEVAARIQGKIPPAVGNNVRALARISMLLNPKTNVRNVVGNALLAPIHVVDDFIGSGIDKAIAKKTGVRTTGNFDVKSTQGFKKGLYESYDDFRRRINTREISGDRFEIGSGPSFNENHTGRVSRYLNPLSKSLNALDRVTSFLLDAGDRPFYETWFINSLNNQMKLNNVTEPTADMIDIATQEALQRTWQDNNGYTDFVKGVRKGLNKLNIKGYGLGDMVITFAKTPANLTKAVVDFSPVGLVKSLAGQGRMLNNAIKTGKATPQMQRAFVKSLSEGISGTLLMILWGAMANAGSLSGKGDDDKDVRNFERNVLGIQPYSVKVGDKSYSYEWASPLGTSMAIAADFVDTLKTGKYNGYFQGGSTAEELANAILSALQSGGSVLYNQSFMQGLQNLFKEDSVIKGVMETLTDEPAKFTPQVLGQTAQLFDGTARQTYEYGKPVSTAMNKVKAKIPGLRNQLEPSLDVLGREIKTHDDAFNVYFNPANNTAARATQGSKEMYRLYQKTGDKAVIPPVAPYYIEIEDKKQILSPKERNKFQKVTGKVAVDGVKELTKSNVYKRLSDSDKADIVKDLYSYGNALAKSEVSEYQLEKKNEKIYKAGQKGVSPAEYLLVYSQMDTDGNNSISQEEARQALDNTSLTREQKAYLFALQNSAWKSNPYRYTARSATTKNIARWSARR